jgi:HAD superfamily phosphatase
MDVLIFDMDGVLIDVTNSYRKTIQQTVDLYLEACLGFAKGRKPLVSGEDISLFKSAGGFNNDWDLTSGLLLYVLSLSGLPPLPRLRRPSSIGEIVSHLKTASSTFRRTMKDLIPKKDLSPFIERVRSAGGGLAGVRRVLGPSQDGWVYRSGELDRRNLVKRIFQEVYLGREFRSYYDLQPLFYRGRGYYLQERLLIPRRVLALLRGKLHLGIASGRPGFEARLALKRFRLDPYFDSVVTLDECREEEERLFRSAKRRVKLTKPHPYPILRAVQEIGLRAPSCGYVGDVVDDMVAARRAKRNIDILAIGFLSEGKRDKTAEERLLEAGADRVVRSHRELLQALKPLLPL